MGRIFLCGDIHKNSNSLADFCHMYEKKLNLSTDDIMILLGDSAINWFLNEKDDSLKMELNSMPLTFFVLRGNHDARILDTIAKRTPDSANYEKMIFADNYFYREKQYPNIFFFRDDPAIYKISGHRILTLPGAYSVDAPYRKARGDIWFENEQLTETELNKIEKLILCYQPDIILSHTAPASLVPTDLFLRSIDQSKVDHTMENCFDKIYKTADYKLWCWGHYHAYRDYNDAGEKQHIMLDGNSIINLEDAFTGNYELYDMGV